ncbi:hypothetical protein KFE25_007913 [Diacronema lutheri]|uniref:COP9 signalosome complex subunit 3 n=1 Tax=Diacronema lutheri TaxID=2081491 RepID=A0A8J5XU09_DIALT|nr:hypothetical protein KFE25_007913 [Diacronema lutheri]
MDTIVSAITSARTPDEHKALVATLRSQEELLFRHAMSLDDLCEPLSAPAHTLGLVFALNVRASALAQAGASPLASTFVQRCRLLLLHADRAQLVFAPLEFSRLCAKFLTFALPQPSGALLAVRPLLAAAAALAPTPNHITPVHALALQAAILAKTYRAALPILDATLVQIDVPRTGVTAHDVLLLHYYAGIALVGLKRHARAAQSFQLVLTAPALVLNSIIVEAYKKWTLCSLIASRAVPALPRYAATAVTRHVRSAAGAYTDLAGAFASRESAKLRRVLVQHAAVYRKDGNAGLVKQCASAFDKECIERLSRTYVTLSLQQLASAAGLGSAEQAEALLLKMAEQGELRAQVDRVRGMALFADSDGPDSDELKAGLDARLETAVALTQKLRALHDELAGDASFLAKTVTKGDRVGARAHLGPHHGADEMAVM